MEPTSTPPWVEARGVSQAKRVIPAIQRAVRAGKNWTPAFAGVTSKRQHQVQDPSWPGLSRPSTSFIHLFKLPNAKERTTMRAGLKEKS